MTTIEDKFNSLCGENEFEKFELYYNLLTEYNEKINLTAITERSEVFSKHFADSIAAADFISGSVLDVGAGAGFPSLPLKIINPSLKVTMADSLLKRVEFLKTVIERLNLSGIRAVHSRAEDLKKDVLYDCAIARAVAPLNVLAEYMLPFTKVGGKVIAYKAKEAEKETEGAQNAISLLGGGKTHIVKMKLNEQTERTLIIIDKVKETPQKYPRGGNKPRLKPL